MITDIDITHALIVCTEATPGPGVWAAKNDDTRAEAIERFTQHYDLARVAPGGSEVLHQVDLPIERDADGAFCFAVTGNGPHGAANARFIATTLHPEFGYAAVLQQLRDTQVGTDKELRDLASELAHAHLAIARHQTEIDADQAVIAAQGALLVRARDMLGAVGSEGSIAVRDDIAAAIGEGDSAGVARRDPNDRLRVTLLAAIGALSEALEIGEDMLVDSHDYTARRIRELREQQNGLTAIAANAAAKPPADMQRTRPPYELAALEVGFTIAKAHLDSNPIANTADLTERITSRTMPDMEIVSMAFGILCRDLIGTPYSDRKVTCGWCVDAAGGGDQAHLDAPAYDHDDLKSHNIRCPNNPFARLYAAADRWRQSFESLPIPADNGDAAINGLHAAIDDVSDLAAKHPPLESEVNA